jgi:hypothetical protein
MTRFTITYVFTEKIRYESRDTAVRFSNEFAEGLADTEALDIVSVSVTETDEPNT